MIKTFNWSARDSLSGFEMGGGGGGLTAAIEMWGAAKRHLRPLWTRTMHKLVSGLGNGGNSENVVLINIVAFITLLSHVYVTLGNYRIFKIITGLINRRLNYIYNFHASDDDR